MNIHLTQIRLEELGGDRNVRDTCIVKFGKNNFKLHSGKITSLSNLTFTVLLLQHLILLVMALKLTCWTLC